MLPLSLFLFLIITALATSQDKEPKVRILHGVLQGTWKNSTKGRIYGSFEGIPYARPPLGKHRFRVSKLYYHSNYTYISTIFLLYYYIHVCQNIRCLYCTDFLKIFVFFKCFSSSKRCFNDFSDIEFIIKTTMYNVYYEKKQ